MDKMHNKYPDAFFVMYQWDSIKNNKNAELIAKYFNKFMSFNSFCSFVIISFIKVIIIKYKKDIFNQFKIN